MSGVLWKEIPVLDIHAIYGCEVATAIGRWKVSLPGQVAAFK